MTFRTDFYGSKPPMDSSMAAFWLLERSPPSGALALSSKTVKTIIYINWI